MGAMMAALDTKEEMPEALWAKMMNMSNKGGKKRQMLEIQAKMTRTMMNLLTEIKKEYLNKQVGK